MCSTFSRFQGLPGLAIHDELRVGLHQLLDDAQTVGAHGRTRFSDFDDGVAETGNDLRLGGAPGKFHLDADALGREIPLGEIDELRRDLLALQVLDALNRGVEGHGEHPTRRPLADFGVDQVGHDHHVRVVFHDPVFTREAGVEGALAT